ncbi:hypothetical protein B0T24DRAFT_587506 [Lasiosphaeria ovina]|uniref:Uncharacterized protein n=1 Tax=Lasiosphaeria ovina TaxID=92902 RepID=A0AAE0NJU9_9PEZI|nr:hypothetical protein B0T24DRAFT_587506 [Lasiosphaeria ovina]
MKVSWGAPAAQLARCACCLPLPPVAPGVARRHGPLPLSLSLILQFSPEDVNAVPCTACTNRLAGRVPAVVDPDSDNPSPSPSPTRGKPRRDCVHASGQGATRCVGCAGQCHSCFLVSVAGTDHAVKVATFLFFVSRELQAAPKNPQAARAASAARALGTSASTLQNLQILPSAASASGSRSSARHPETPSASRRASAIVVDTPIVSGGSARAQSSSAAPIWAIRLGSRLQIITRRLHELGSLCGMSEERLTAWDAEDLLIHTFQCPGTRSRNPSTSCRPYNTDRSDLQAQAFLSLLWKVGCSGKERILDGG